MAHSLPPTLLAAEALATIPLPDGVRVLGGSNWLRRAPELLWACRLLVAMSPQANPCLMDCEVSFDDAGAVRRARLIEPCFGSTFAESTDLPTSVANIPSVGANVDGLYFDERTGLLWTPGPFGKGTYTFDSANRLPARLAERDGYRNYKDWRLPTDSELLELGDLLRVDTSDIGQLFLERLMGDSGSHYLWSSTPALSVSPRTGSSFARLRNWRLPIVLVRAR